MLNPLRDYDKEIGELKKEKEDSLIQAGWERLSNFPFKDYNGQQVLAVHRYGDTEGCTGFGGEGIEVTRTAEYLGILKEPFIERKEMTFEIKTNKHAFRSDRSYGQDWKLGERGIDFDLFYLKDILVDQRPGDEEVFRKWNIANDSGGLRIFVGNETVSDYFRGKFDAPKVIFEMNPERYRILSYVDALYLLGLEAPEDFKNIYKSNMREKRLNVFNTLRKLAFEDLELTRQINKIDEKIKDGDSQRMDEVKESRREKRKRQLELQEAIVPNIKKAIELGMHTREEVLDLEFGTKVPLGTYVTELSKYYKVEIPSK